MDIIDQEAHRIQHLVDDLFELAKMEEGQIPLHIELVDFAGITGQAVRKLELTARDKGIRLLFNISGEAVPIPGDAKRLEQIVMNLLENAVRYTDEEKSGSCCSILRLKYGSLWRIQGLAFLKRSCLLYLSGSTGLRSHAPGSTVEPDSVCPLCTSWRGCWEGC